MEIRERVINKKADGKTVKEIVDELDVSKNFVYEIMALQKTFGNIEPKKGDVGRRSKLTDKELEQIERKIADNRNITLQEIKEDLNLTVALSTLCDAIIYKLNMNYIKTLHAIGQNREDVQERRKEWQEQQKDMNPEKLIFLDESSINLGMTRLYGRAHNGERVIDYVLDVRFERTSILSSLRLDGTSVPLTFKGTLNGTLFRTYIHDCLVPTRF